MILAGYLCEPKALSITSTTNLSGIKSVAGDFNQSELEEKVDNPLRNRLIVKAYKEYAQKRKSTLVFCVGIKHLNHVVEEFQSEGIYCKGLDSTNSKEDRAAIIEEFKSGKLPVLVNCGVLTTGFDYEELDTLLISRPTKSKILYTQIVGRGLRTAEGKKDCLIIDITDVSRSHDLLSLSNVFDMPIRNGETVKKAIKRIEKEKENAEQLKREAEERQRERERFALEQIKLKAQEIKLFNHEMKTLIESRSLDWWKVDNLSFALSYANGVHYVIEDSQNTYKVYSAVTEREDKRISELSKFEELLKAVKYVENNVNKGNSYISKNSSWKSDPPSPAQLKYVPYAKDKWDVYKQFNANTIRSLLKRHRETS
jgi:type I site-specific restriction endonuclease